MTRTASPPWWWKPWHYRSPAAKRVLWCHWFHRWHDAYLGGQTRTSCWACEDCWEHNLW